jgi:hypothetical protein
MLYVQVLDESLQYPFLTRVYDLPFIDFLQGMPIHTANQKSQVWKHHLPTSMPKQCTEDFKLQIGEGMGRQPTAK